MRLSELGYQMGLLPKRHFESFQIKRKQITDELIRLHQVRVGTTTLAQLLRRPGVTYKSLPLQNSTLSAEAALEVEIEVKYEGYIRRQELEARKARAMEDKQIPPSFDFARVPSLRSEARQKLTQIRPATLGQASRISGVSPADMSSLAVWLGRAGTVESGAMAATALEATTRPDDEIEA